MNDQQRAAMIRPHGKSEAPHMIAAYRAMQMALEALIANLRGTSGRFPLTNEAITALREALSAESTGTCSASAQPQETNLTKENQMTHQENNTTPSADFQEGWKLGQQAMLDTVQAHMNELFYPDRMSDGSIPNDTPVVPQGE